jgi:hypothetical protein
MTRNQIMPNLIWIYLTPYLIGQDCIHAHVEMEEKYLLLLGLFSLDLYELLFPK